jgi:hypothetical protein
MNGLERATALSSDHLIDTSKSLVERFTSAERVRQQLQAKIKHRKKVQGFVTGFGLMAAGYGGTIAVVSPTPVQMVAAQVNLIVSAYIGLQGIANQYLPEVAPDFPGMLRDGVGSTMGQVKHERITNIEKDFRNLKRGETNRAGMNIAQLLMDEHFFAPDDDLLLSLQKREEQWNFAGLMNVLWTFERPYILDVDAPEGCESDKRGPSEYRVCLPEFPNRSFWLYSIGRVEEKDTFRNDQAQVTGPYNFHAFDKENTETHLLTREDIIRSSLFVHRHNLHDAIESGNITVMRAAFQQEGYELPVAGPSEIIDRASHAEKGNLGKVPGQFRIAVCRNPGGEAVSSVWSDDSRNYPCMCGEFLWDGTYGSERAYELGKDQILKFLEVTEFMFSEDWEDYCSGHNGCEGLDSVDINAVLEAKRHSGDPSIPEKLKHPFQKCDKPQGHATYGYPDNDIVPEPY